jgi:hypothetical protein
MPDNEIILELTGIAQKLLLKLQTLAWPAGEKYCYFNANQSVVDLGISMPKNFRGLKPGVGWASRAVNTLSDRINFDGFANDKVGINDLLDDTGAFTVFGKAKSDALIAGCAFIAVLPTEDSVKLLPFTAVEATGTIDQRTGLLDNGLAVLRWYQYDPANANARGWSKVGLVPQDYAVFTKDYTAYFINQQLAWITVNPTKRPLLHVITHRQSADRPFGKSRISNTVRRIIDEVGRLKVRYEIAAEFYSTPQRYVNGLADGSVDNATLEAALGKIWTITKDEDGEKPEIGQLAQMSINQFSDQKKDLARDFCAETALTLRNLGYETANPTSAESLSAMSDDLLLEAQACQTEFGREFREIAISARMAIDKTDSVPSGLRAIEAAWKPVFQIDVASAGDAAYKLIQAMPELAGTTTLYRMLGMNVREAEELAEKSRNARPNDFMQIGRGE